jgi:hypothetical protein
VIAASWAVTIDRRPEDVFDFVADLHNEPRFNPDASNVVKTSDGNIGLGTIYAQDVKRVGSYTTTIDRFARPAMLGFDARNPKCDALVRFTFAPAGEATDVGCSIELTFKGFQRLFEPLLRGKIVDEIEGTAAGS